MARRKQHQPLTLDPLSGEPTRKRFVCYDIESKAGPTSKAGFTRPFLVGFYEEHPEVPEPAPESGESPEFSEPSEPPAPPDSGVTLKVITPTAAPANDADPPNAPPKKPPIKMVGTFTRFRDSSPIAWRIRPCRWCKRKIQGYDETRLCSSPHATRADGSARPCEHANWEEEHLASYRGCMDKFLRRFFTARFDGCVLYAHNGGSFDHLFMLTWLTRHRYLGFDFTVVPVMSSIQQITVTRRLKVRNPVTGKRVEKKFEWSIRDSMRLFPSALDKIAKAFGLGGKLDMDLDAPEDDPRWEEYLEVDCVKLHQSMVKYHDLVEKLGGEVGMTAPSTAMKLFRRQYQDKPIYRHCHWPGCTNKTNGKCDDCFHHWIRRGYYGGRTEIFELIGKFLHYYDLNSSYVAAMLEEQPVGQRVIHEGHIDWDMRRTHIGFAEVTVQIPDDCEVPPLPVRAEKSAKLIFPAGQLTGVWDVDEIALVVDKERDPKTCGFVDSSFKAVRGTIVKVGTVAWIQHAPVLKRMMEALWSLRDKNLPGYDEALSELGKLLGNSTYGKFGMDPEKEEIVFARPFKMRFPEDETGTPMKRPVFECILCGQEQKQRICEDCIGSKTAGHDPGSKVWFKARRVTAAYIIPQIASHITTTARIRLWNYMVMAHRKMLVVANDAEKGVDVARRTLKSARAARIERARWRRRGFTNGSVAIERGRVMNTDTDSVMCNVEIPSSKTLGHMKDEYPGEVLDGQFIQPKVYVLSKATPFAKEHVVGCKDKACKGCSHHKIAMKGLPKAQRTIANIEKLLEGGTVEFERLEKIRTLAGAQFKRPPSMVGVKKRIVGAYDKRVVLEDGVRTRPISLQMPILGEIQDA